MSNELQVRELRLKGCESLTDGYSPDGRNKKAKALFALYVSICPENYLGAFLETDSLQPFY